MSTVERAHPTKILPPLVNGQHLDQPTFHERYEAMPPETSAELIGGVVFLTPAHRVDYGETCMDVSGWLFRYKMKTAGLRGGGHSTIKMDVLCEVEPECSLRIPESLGGRSWVDEDGYLCGAPELLIEVDDSSRDLDLVLKKYEYERAGILEYLFVGLNPQELCWFVRRGYHFADFLPGPDGIYRSEVFPGLWLDPQALYAEDLDQLAQVLELGLATPDHAAFAARMAPAHVRRKRR